MEGLWKRTTLLSTRQQSKWSSRERVVKMAGARDSLLPRLSSSHVWGRGREPGYKIRDYKGVNGGINT